MKDIADSLTVEIFPIPKKRGRPPKPGGAKTGAERQRAYLANKKKSPVSVITRSDFVEFLRRERIGLIEVANSNSEFAIKAQDNLDFLKRFEISFYCYLENQVDLARF